MNRRSIILRTSAAVAALLAAVAVSPHAADPQPPKLAVILVVDQMRADFVDRFMKDWTGGLRRLVDEGAWFRQAAYPYLTTVTCAGHATIGTGAFPHVHGIFQNTWWDRDTHQVVNCVDDAKAKDIGYAANAHGGRSASRLLIPTFADEMRAQRSAHVVALALKDRSAIMLAGHGGDAVTWLSESLDGWATSSVFASRPVDPVKTFLAANPIDADFGKAWTPLLPTAQYHETDAGAGEAPPPGWTPEFPHVLTGPSNAADVDFRVQWERSPYADEYVGRFGAALAESMQLGKHAGTDVLAISFSSPDLVGHAFGPLSLEVHDMFLRLDRTIGALLQRLDALVGRGEYVVALSADHGVTPIPEQLVAAGTGGGRITQAEIAGAVETRAHAALGRRKYVANISTNDIYFEPGMYAKLTSAPAVLADTMSALRALPGIARVLRREEVADVDRAADDLTRAAALSYVPGRSGDLILILKPGWMMFASGTTHGSGTPDDQRVPLLFMGRAFKPGRYDQPVTPADIAPTLAAICGITLPRAEGRALRVAMQ